VKWRGGGQALDLAIDSHRLRRVAAAAEAIAPRFTRAGDDQRIDVLLLAPGRLPRHIVNAWMG
jgi:putative endonuclease